MSCFTGSMGGVSVLAGQEGGVGVVRERRSVKGKEERRSES